MKWLRFKSSRLLVVLVLTTAALVAGLAFIYGPISMGSVALEVLVEKEVATVGVPFDVTVNLSNISRSVLRDVALSLDVPEGVVLINGEGKVVRREFGEINVGDVHQEIFRVMAVSSEISEKEFTVTVSYVPGSLSASLEKSGHARVRVEDTGLGVSLTAPEKVFSHEEFEVVMTYFGERTQKTDLFPVKLKIEHPEVFTIISTDPKPTGGMTWDLGALESGKEEIKVRGSVDLPDDAQFSLQAHLIANFLGEDHVVASATKRVSIAPSPLSFQISLNGNTDQYSLVYRLEDALEYILTYKNNTDVVLKNVSIRAQLIGSMFDFLSLESDGVWNRYSSTLTWNKNVIEELAELRPRAVGRVQFKIKVKDSYPIKRLNDKNFTLEVKASIESPTVPYLIAADKTINSDSLTAKVAGRIAVDAQGFFRDAPSGILNDGPFPPRVGKPTQFAIHWRLKNFSTDVRDIEMRALFEDGVTFTGVVKSNTSSQPEINAESGEIVWKIDRLIATTGVLSEGPEAIFQVEATPRNYHAGDYMPLFSSIIATAFDEFANLEIKSTDETLTTRLPDDPTILEEQGIVIE